MSTKMSDQTIDSKFSEIDSTRPVRLEPYFSNCLNDYSKDSFCKNNFLWLGLFDGPNLPSLFTELVRSSSYTEEILEQFVLADCPETNEDVMCTSLDIDDFLNLISNLSDEESQREIHNIIRTWKDNQIDVVVINWYKK